MRQKREIVTTFLGNCHDPHNLRQTPRHLHALEARLSLVGKAYKWCMSMTEFGTHPTMWARFETLLKNELHATSIKRADILPESARRNQRRNSLLNSPLRLLSPQLGQQCKSPSPRRRKHPTHKQQPVKLPTWRTMLLPPPLKVARRKKRQKI